MDLSIIEKSISFIKKLNIKSLCCISKYKTLDDILFSYNPNNIDVYYLDTFFDYDLIRSIKKQLSNNDGFNNRLFLLFNDNLDESDLINNYKSFATKLLELIKNKNISLILYLGHNYPYKIHIQSLSERFRNLMYSDVRINEFNNITYIGQIGTSGYAVSGVRYIADYIMKGYNVSWKPLIFDNTSFDLRNWINLMASNTINKEIIAKEYAIVHSIPTIWRSIIEENKLKEYKKLIGYCAWETNKLPLYWKKCLNELYYIDEIQVPSNFNKQVFIESGIRNNIVVKPHIFLRYGNKIDKKDIDLIDCFGNKIPKNKYTFYTIGEYIFRKGIDDLIRVFNKFHVKYKESQLILKLNYKTYHAESINYIIKCIEGITNLLGHSIFVIYKTLNDNEINALHSFGDCYISLTKGEGFGLPIFDAYNYGKQIICTGYGGQLDYLGKDYNGLINYKLLPVDEKESFKFNNFYTKDQLWAYPDLDHCYSIMENKIIENICC